MKPVWQKVTRLNFDGTCFVENKHGKKYQVNIPKHLEGVRTGDKALVQKSPVSGEWNMLDYKIRPSYFEDVDHGCDASDAEPEYWITLEDYL